MAEQLVSLYPFSMSQEGRNLVSQSHSGFEEPRTLALSGYRVNAFMPPAQLPADNGMEDDMASRISNLQELGTNGWEKRSPMDTFDGEGGIDMKPRMYLRQTKRNAATSVFHRF